VSIESLAGTKLIEADIVTTGEPVRLGSGSTRVQFRIAALHLNPGLYAVRLWLGHTTTSGFDHIPVAFQIEVVRPPTSSDVAPQITAGAVSCQFAVSQD
jgi:hypothetical protein